MIKWNYELVKDFIEKEGYFLLSDSYIKAHDKLTIKCPQGHIFEMSFNNFKRGQRCKQCDILSRRKYSQEEVRYFLEREGYEMIGEFKSLIDSIEVVCPQGHNTTISFASFEKGCRCKHCKPSDRKPIMEGFKENNKELGKNGNKKYSLEEAKDLLAEVGFEMLDNEYNGIKSQVTFKCSHGHIHTMRFDKARKGKCPKCAEENAFYNIDFIKEYLKKDGYTLISTEYKGIYETIEVMCDEGHLYETTFNNYKNYGFRCPICKSSIGERRIQKYLVENNINYIHQKRFKDCKDIYSLPFDFYLPQYNLIIEYDGRQHFMIVDKFGGEEDFIKRIIHDAIKNQYCEDNNINILRIPYWEQFKIENLISQTIENLSRITFND